MDWSGFLCERETILDELKNMRASSKTETWHKLLAKHQYEPIPELQIDPWRTGRAPSSYLLPKLPGWHQVNEIVATATPRSGVQYLLLRSWSVSDPKWLDPAKELIRNVSREETLIIDVRPNAGGSEFSARSIASCFVAEPKVYAKNRNIIPRSDPLSFTNLFDRAVNPAAEKDRFRGKQVFVLMGANNMSRCEAFLLMMKKAGAVLFGERSYGSSGNPKPHPLSNGIEIYLPSWQAYDFVGEPIEGIGIEPDITVETNEADFRKRDPVLATALVKAIQQPVFLIPYGSFRTNHSRKNGLLNR